MPSASTSISAPGHRRWSKPRARTGPRRTPRRPRGAPRARRRATSREQRAGRAVQVPLRPLLAVDPDRHERGLRVELVGRDHARPEGQRDSLGRGRRVAAPVRGSGSRRRACSRTRRSGRPRARARSSTGRRRTAAIFGRNSSQPAPAGHGDHVVRARTTGRAPSTASAERSAVGSSGASRRGVLDDEGAPRSSRSRAARAASSTVPPLLPTRRSIVVGEGRVPDQVGQVDHPAPRGALPVAGAPSGRRSRASREPDGTPGRGAESRYPWVSWPGRTPVSRLGGDAGPGYHKGWSARVFPTGGDPWQSRDSASPTPP